VSDCLVHVAVIWHYNILCVPTSHWLKTVLDDLKSHNLKQSLRFRTGHSAGCKLRVTLHGPVVKRLRMAIFQKEHKHGAHFPYIRDWARSWINHYCLWRIASAMPDLQLPSQPKLVLIVVSIHRGMARLSWPGWLVTYHDSLLARRWLPIQALTGPSVE